MPNPTESTAIPGTAPTHETRTNESSTERLRREADEATTAARDEAAKLGESLKSSAKAEAGSLKEQAKAQVAEQRFDAAKQIDAVAAALRAGVDTLESDGHRDMAEWWRSAADGAGRLADRVRDKPLADAWRDTEGFVREEPTLSFGGAMVAGFMIARFLKSSAPSDTERGRSADTGQRPAPTSDTAFGAPWPSETEGPRSPAPPGTTTAEPGSSWPGETEGRPAPASAGTSAAEPGSTWSGAKVRDPARTSGRTAPTDRPNA